MRARRNPLERAWAALQPWSILAVAAVGGAAVVAGVFDPEYPQRWLSVVIGLGVLAPLVWDARRRFRGTRTLRPFGEIEGPLLWTVGVWLLMRLGGPFSGHLTPLAAALLAWQVATFPKRVYLFAVIAAAGLEIGLTAAGRQSPVALGLHALMYGGAVFALSKLALSEAFRRSVDEAATQREKADEDRRRAEDFGLLTAQAPALRELPSLQGVTRPTVGQSTLDYLRQSFTLQLEVLRDALGLTTAAVLWRSADGLLQLRGFASSRYDLQPGPWPAKTGVTASVIRGDSPEVAVAPVHKGFAGLPYYADIGELGGVLAVAIPEPTDAAAGLLGEPAGVLVLDRTDPTPWAESERRTARLVARKLALDVATGQRLKAADHERSTISRFCAGLQEMNGALGLEQVAAAALQAARALVQTDVSVLSVRSGSVHRVVSASGHNADLLADLEFADDEGLVGQAVRINQPLPVGGVWRGKRPVFTGERRLDDMKSLLVIPLAPPDGEPIGALTVAAREPGAFDAARVEMLALIAGQVGIKLDLARAHEQIREMATIDGLTGLNNHRTFQLAFDTMLSRASRTDRPLSFLLTDIDKFKVLNDTYGHPFGDEVLKGVASVLAGAVRKIDLAARYGGEEFAVILEESDLEGAMHMAERIRQEVEALEFEHEKGPVKVTLSIGVSAFPGDGSKKATLIERADQALYQAKRGGRNQVVAWSALNSVSRAS